MYFIASLLIIIVLLFLGFNIKISEIKKLKDISNDQNLIRITNKLPDNKSICKDILRILKNTDVKIEEDKESTTSLYMVKKNKIIIANIDESFTRIQTIAHECIHSIQDKRILKFNFVIANLYMLYFVFTCVMMIFKFFEFYKVFFYGLIILGFIHIVIRSFLEIDAMCRARYIAEKYMDFKNILTNEEKDIILKKYDETNKIGIKLYYLIIIIKTILSSIICYLFQYINL